MFHRADLGIIIAGAHYISSLLVGLIMRFYSGDGPEKPKIKKKINNRKNIFVNAIFELITARKNDGRSLGELLGDSVRESINTLLMIGGFIILFSVVTKIITITGFIAVISKIIMFILKPFGLSQAIVLPLISGFFEITNGSNLASQAQAPLLEQLIIVNTVIAWSGLSVHAQVATMINGTDINLKPYLFARIVQGLLAGVITIFIYLPFSEKVKPTFLPMVSEVTELRDFLLLILLGIGIIIFLALIVSLMIHYLHKIKIFIFHSHN